uniref:Guanine nucleotide-binding protein subunit gamma n=1 Tax=Kwoniella dejecticola CBS 10117 TaxID=1296121 RepID=A0A1A5ZUB4_9TREE|nr:guanine nucleotide-binding protein subunit gamma [Kwoniella dejecticola CBS 10117]OBR81402.1 guanine nucleotide-binding protein subunit gamma [Kwoniella dejecticola CBS 10117]
MNGHTPSQDGLGVSDSTSHIPTSAAAGGQAQGRLIRPKGHKQSMAELKLRRLTEHNLRLRDDLARPRVRVSEASLGLLKYCTSTKDPMVSSGLLPMVMPIFTTNIEYHADER